MKRSPLKRHGTWKQGVIRAKPKYVDGIWFPSTGEADTYAVLATWQKGGVIRELERQPKVTLLPAVPDHSIQSFIWRPDFTFIDDRGVRVWLDAKDRPTSKREDEGSAPGKMDAKGTGAITDMVDNILTAWRNKKKEEKVRALTVDAPIPDELEKQPDAILYCHKQRHFDWEGKVCLHFHKSCHVFTARAARPVALVADRSQTSQPLHRPRNLAESTAEMED